MTDTPAAPRGRPLVVGANHRSSSLMLRDRLFVEERVMADYLARLRAAGLEQAVVLSTCDRVEVQGVHEPDRDPVEAVVAVMAAHAELRPRDLEGQVYVLRDAAAVRHVFAVPASLDSLMIGEPQVFGQVKDAHRFAHDAGMTGSDLEALLQAAFSAAKRVRTETAVGEGPVSIAAVAVQLARDLHGDLDRCQCLLVGAGDMGELVASDLLREGLSRLTVCHPTDARAEALSRSLECHWAPFATLETLLPEADIVLTSMGRRHHTIVAPMVAKALKARRNRPVFVVDTGIPGDVEPAVGDFDDAFLYDLNDLERVAMAGRASREAEAQAAWKILDEEVAAFRRGRAERAAVPALVGLRHHFETVRATALADAHGDAEKATHLLVARLLHEPSEALRAMAATGAEMRRAEDLLRTLFRFDDEETRR